MGGGCGRWGRQFPGGAFQSNGHVPSTLPCACGHPGRGVSFKGTTGGSPGFHRTLQTTQPVSDVPSESGGHGWSSKTVSKATDFMNIPISGKPGVSSKDPFRGEQNPRSSGRGAHCRSVDGGAPGPPEEGWWGGHRGHKHIRAHPGPGLREREGHRVGGGGREGGDWIAGAQGPSRSTPVPVLQR